MTGKEGQEGSRRGGGAFLGGTIQGKVGSFGLEVGARARTGTGAEARFGTSSRYTQTNKCSLEST